MKIFCKNFAKKSPRPKIFRTKNLRKKRRPLPVLPKSGNPKMFFYSHGSLHALVTRQSLYNTASSSSGSGDGGGGNASSANDGGCVFKLPDPKPILVVQKILNTFSNNGREFITCCLYDGRNVAFGLVSKALINKSLTYNEVDVQFKEGTVIQLNEYLITDSKNENLRKISGGLQYLIQCLDRNKVVMIVLEKFCVLGNDESIERERLEAEARESAKELERLEQWSAEQLRIEQAKLDQAEVMKALDRFWEKRESSSSNNNNNNKTAAKPTPSSSSSKPPNKGLAVLELEPNKQAQQQRDSGGGGGVKAKASKKEDCDDAASAAATINTINAGGGDDHDHDDDNNGSLKISELNMGIGIGESMWSLRVCLSRIGIIRDFYNNEQGPGKTMRLQFYDETGYIELAFFNKNCEFCDKNNLQVNTVYTIRCATIKFSKKSLKAWHDKANSMYDLHFNARKTTVTTDPDQTPIEKKFLNLNLINIDKNDADHDDQRQPTTTTTTTTTTTPTTTTTTNDRGHKQQQQQPPPPPLNPNHIQLAQIYNREVGSFINTTAIVTKIGILDKITRKGQGKVDLPVRRIDIVDSSVDKPISIALWGKQATQCQLTFGKIYLFTDIELTNYLGRSLSIVKKSGFLNVTGYSNVTGVEELSKWWRENKSFYREDQQQQQQQQQQQIKIVDSFKKSKKRRKHYNDHEHGHHDSDDDDDDDDHDQDADDNEKENNEHYSRKQYKKQKYNNNKAS